MIFTKQFLIDELHRFKKENSRIPKMLEMMPENGYPSYVEYHKCFGTWNNTKKIARLCKEKRTGNETCSCCGCTKEETLQWNTKGLSKDEVMCSSCYYKFKSNYINGNLDKNSSTGKAFISQRVVAKFLGLELKNDCNCSVNFSHPFDLYDKGRHNRINVKASHLHKDNRWLFNYSQKEIPDTYILIGFDEKGKHILKGWIIDSNDSLLSEKKGVSITNTYSALTRFNKCEIDDKLLDSILHQMSKKRKETNGKECILSNDDLIKNN